jgi:hypothetical protein
MWYPTIEINGKRVLILNGYEKSPEESRVIAVAEETKLQVSSAKHRDAVAFTYFDGQWIPAV